MRRVKKPTYAAVASEHEEQVTFVDYVRTRYPGAAPYLFAVPNGGVRAWKTAQRLKAEGVSPGYPDIGLDLPVGPYHGFRVEMKRRAGSRTSADQHAWIARLKKAGYACFICMGADAAIAALDDYLAGRKP